MLLKADTAPTGARVETGSEALGARETLEADTADPVGLGLVLVGLAQVKNGPKENQGTHLRGQSKPKGHRQVT